MKKKLKIEMKKNVCFLDGQKYGTKGKYENLGDYIRNLLFYNNKEGLLDYEIFVDDVESTNDFKTEIRQQYQNINNTKLRDDFYKWCNIKGN